METDGTGSGGASEGSTSQDGPGAKGLAPGSPGAKSPVPDGPVPSSPGAKSPVPDGPVPSSPVPSNTGLEAPVTAVTVFRHAAQVTRTGAANLTPGLQPVVVSGLPPSADRASVRVAVRGEHVALLEVEVNRRYGADPVRAETSRLRSEVERWRDAVQALDDEDAACQARLNFADHLSDAAATALARAVGFGRAGQGELDQMSDHLAGSTASALESRRDIAVRKRVAQRELEAAEHRLAVAEKQAGTGEFTEVSASIEATAATRAEIELTYHVPNANWRPLYDLGLSGDRLTVNYLAQVTQQTGEDWPAVPLTLSTTRQGSQRELPELAPWYITRQAPASHPPVRARLLAAGGPEEPSESFVGSGPRAAMMPQAAPLTAEVSESTSGQIYRVPRPLAVPSDGSPHKTTIAKIDLDAEVDHLAVPLVAPEAYLRAKVTNSSPLLLLPGSARIFLDGQFAGETGLETVATGEEFELQLGVDDQVRIDRKLTRRTTSKAVLGGTRTIDIAYEMSVENHRRGPVRVSVKDHIPVSTDAEIKVRLRETSPQAAEQTDLGELTWHLTLGPGEFRTIRHRFTVEHPAGVTVTGL